MLFRSQFGGRMRHREGHGHATGAPDAARDREVREARRAEKSHARFGEIGRRPKERGGGAIGCAIERIICKDPIRSGDMADHFSSVATQYAQSRPSYPTELPSWLASLAPGHDLAWDCATGSGQAAVMLAGHFARVEATDLSPAQLSHAVAHARVVYRQAPERASGLPDACCDLVTVAQAAHWLDRPAFYAEAGRVLRPRGILALWGYGLVEISPELDPIVDDLALRRLDPYWPPGREHVMDRYQTIARSFPYQLLEGPSFTMQLDWTADQFLGFARSWSAADRGKAAEGRDPVSEFAPAIERAWGAGIRAVRWPIFLLVGRTP